MNFRAPHSLLTPQPVIRSRVVGVDMVGGKVSAIETAAGLAPQSIVAPPAF